MHKFVGYEVWLVINWTNNRQINLLRLSFKIIAKKARDWKKLRKTKTPHNTDGLKIGKIQSNQSESLGHFSHLGITRGSIRSFNITPAPPPYTPTVIC